MSDPEFYPVPHLEAITRGNRDLKDFKRTYMAKAQAEFERQSAMRRMRLDLAIREAFEAGATKADLNRALETKDRNTLLQILARTAQEEN